MDQAIKDSEFFQAFRGSFVSLLRWPQFDEFWENFESYTDDNWYIYAIGTPPPENTVTKETLASFLAESKQLLRKEHQEDYCGIVYVDDKTKPSFIKIFDPNNLGVSCGFSDSPPLPGWIISRIKPTNLSLGLQATESRKRWWQKLFHQ